MIKGSTWSFSIVSLCIVHHSPPLAAQGLYEERVPGASSPSLASSSSLRDAVQKIDSGPPVTFTVRDSTIAYAVRALAYQARRRVSFNESDPLFAKRVTVQVNKVPVMRAFAEILKGTGLTAILASDGETIVIRPIDNISKPAKSAVTGTISGQVLDSITGSGIAGVSIAVQGTKISVVSDEQGRFVLPKVPNGEHVVTFKLIGYANVTRTVQVNENGTASLRVVLKQTASVLSEVVTTITGAQRRLEISNDITTINVDSVMRVAPIRSVTDLLATRVPGLQVLRTTGTPGDPSRLRLRGAGSVNGSNAPIVVVDGVRMYSPDSSVNGAKRLGMTGSSGSDGVPLGYDIAYPAPSSLDQIDPNSIEKIEVLKGPSASALYGADAANGVIVITTRRGRPGVNQMNATLDAGTSEIPGRFPENLFIFGHGINQPDGICQFYNACEIDSLVSFQALNDKRYSPIGRGSSFGASVTVSGGTNLLTYSLTGSASRQNGLTRLPSIAAALYEQVQERSVPGWMRRPDRYDTYSGSSSMQLTPSASLTVLLHNTLTMSEQQRSSLGAESGMQLLNAWFDANGYDIRPRFFLRGFQERVTASTASSRHDISIRWQVMPALPPLSLRAGVNPSQRTGKTSLESGLSPAVGPVDGAWTPSSGTYSISRGNATVYTIGGSTVVPIGLASGMRLNLGLGADLSHTADASQTISTNAALPGVSDPSGFDPERTTVSQATQSMSTGGIYITPELAVGSRVFINTGFRFDGGSASGDRAGLMGMPKIGISWLALDPSRDFVGRGALVSLISHLKLRAALGQAGIQPGPAQHLRLYEQEITSADGGATVQTGYKLISPGNTRLVPERVSEFEGGFDAGLLNDRISMSATYFRKNTQDAILQFRLPASAGGGGNYVVNIGNIRNTGYELSANSRLIERPALYWNVDAALSHRSNRVIALADGMGDQNNLVRRIKVGYPLWGIWARPLGSYGDADGDGIIQADEFTLADSSEYLGSTDPRYTLTMSTNLALLNGRLTLNAAFEYQNGFTQQNINGRYALLRAASIPNASLRDQAIAMMTATFSDATRNYYLTQTVNVFRFHSLSVGYRLPGTIATWFPVRNADLSLQGSNLRLWSNYDGKDPNVNGFSAGNFTADYGQLPQPRQWSLRLNLSR